MDRLRLRAFIKSLSSRPGVYRMYDEQGKVIYVGKTKNLKKRVGSYFRQNHDTAKTRALINNTTGVEVTVTDTEADALLLESNLIKEHRPRYNVVFRDDKSYPYLYLSTDKEFPRLSFYRGARRGKGVYFGPFPSAGASRRTLNLVQKLFKLRQCDETFFRNRGRPCLQYQIKRCSAPCVGYIEKSDYEEDIQLAILFLEGRSDQIIRELELPMQQAAESLEFEKAARYRDQIATLRQFQESQHIVADAGESDVIACAMQSGHACVQMFFIRGGRNLGNKAYFQKAKLDEAPADIIDTFIKQYYLGGDSLHEIPNDIYVSHRPKDHSLLQEVLGLKKGRTVRVRDKVRGERARWIRMARENADISLAQHMSQNTRYREQLEQLGEFLGKGEPVNRIECFDISHLGGNETVGSCVVYGEQGPIKSDYRRFNVEGVTQGDDYAAMAQVIRRHYTRIKKGEGALPDLILIDGGKGQVSHVREALKELQIDETTPLLGIAKGPSRKAGLETLILSDGKSRIRLQEDSVMLHLLQEVRDEAHRFAITGHRSRRKKKQNKSLLDDVEGIGSKRRQQLIHHFGGMQGIEKAGPEELARVPGINRNLAQKIYDTLHNQ